MQISKEKRAAFNGYMETYGDKYHCCTACGIERGFGDDYHDVGTSLYQIYDFLGGIIPDDENEYIAYANFLKSHFPIAGNWIEIGGGPYPSLSIYIEKAQRAIGSGTVTVYDQELVTTDVTGINLISENFKLLTPIPEANLLFGRQSCEFF